MDSSTKERIRALWEQGEEREKREERGRKRERKRRKREKEEEERRKKNRKLSWREWKFNCREKKRAEGGARLGKRTGPLNGGSVCSD